MKHFIQKNKIKLLVIVIVLLTITIGISFSYFAVISGYVRVDANISSGESIDVLEFTAGDALDLTMTQQNLAEGGIDAYSATTATATLTKYSQSEYIFATYDVYFRISVNSFEYSDQENFTPELILTVTDPGGNIVTEATVGTETIYSITTDSGVTGFDVTEITSSILIADNYYIETDDIEEQEWTVKLTVVNLDVNQANNLDAKFTSYLSFNENSGFDPDTISNSSLVYNILMNENDSATSLENAMELIAEKETPDFSTIADTDEGIFVAADDYGTSYYFRGAVEDNYVVWAGFYWRIVRIDGQGNVKLIYAGVYDEDTNPSTLTTTSLQLSSTSAFNSSKTYSYYVGYMYTAGELHGNSTSSKIKTAVDTWYETYLIDYENDIATDAIYCTDRTSYTSSSESDTTQNSAYSTATQYFGAYRRLTTTTAIYSPSLECDNVLDALTWTESNEGTNALTNPVGLISADEVSLAGGKHNTATTSYYLYSGSTYWTLSPYSFHGSNAYVWNVYSTGTLYISSTSLGVATSYGVRPAVSLSSEILITSGDGTSENPYFIAGSN